MLACIDTEWKLLTWVRYTIWIPLYPMGVVAEGRFALRPLLISCYMLVIKKKIYIPESDYYRSVPFQMQSEAMEKKVNRLNYIKQWRVVAVVIHLSMIHYGIGGKPHP